MGRKLTIDMPVKMRQIIDDICEEKGLTMKQFIAESIWIYHLFRESDCELHLVDRDGNVFRRFQ